MTRSETRPSRGVGIDRSRAAAAVLVALAACAVGARAHIDPDDPDQAVHKPWEEHARPSPPPPALDRETFLGGVYDTPLLLREDQEYELMCSVIVKPPGFMYVAPNVTINVRGNCEGADAIAWNIVNPGGSGMKPSIVILPGARLDVRGTPEKPVVIKKVPGSDPSGTTRGDWGGVYMFGRARVSYGANEPVQSANGPGLMKVGTEPGALTESISGLDASQKFVARHAPEATFPACDDGHGQPFCDEFQPSKDLAGDGYLDSHFRRFEYGGDDDAGSCGSLENLVVLNAGGGDSGSVTRPVALGLYGCGVATTLRNVEVAHADGVGIELRGGAALVRDVAVWSVTSHAVSASGGYRGAMRNVFVDVDGAEPVSALRVEGDLDASVGATQYRTHPHVYSSTLVASGDDDGYYASLAATGAPPAAVATGIISAANAAGLTLVNSIVLSRSIRRSRGVEVSGCSNEMDVGNEAAIGAPDAAEATPSAARLFVSDRNVIAGFGAHPADASFGAFPTSMREVLDTTGEYHYVGSNTTRREFDETWLGANAIASDQDGFVEVTARDWRAFGLSAGCEYKLNLADDKRPQLRSMFFPSDAPSAVEFLDPRPTELMRDAHKVDQPPKRASRGFALSAPTTALPTTKAAIDALLSEPVEFPGAFTLDPSSVWFGPSVRNEPPAVRGATLTSAAVPEAEPTPRLYAHFRVFATATASSSGSTSGKRKLLSTESRGELESLIRRLARPTTRARGSGDAVSDTALGASRSLLFFGGDTSGVTGAYGSAATVCPAWEKIGLCEIFGSESADACSGVQSSFGVACEFSSPYSCSPANGGGDAYLKMNAMVESFMSVDECHQLSTSMCVTNDNCRVSPDGDYCDVDFSVVRDDISAALVTDGASAIAKNYFSLWADLASCDYLSESECSGNSLCTYDSDYGDYGLCHGDIFPVLNQVQTLCADVDDAEIGSFTTLTSMFSGGSGSGGGDSGSGGGDSGSGGASGPAAVCPAWEMAELCRFLGGESADACSSVFDKVGVVCQYTAESDCVPESGADAYNEMVADVESIATSYGDGECGVYASQTDCEANAKCSFITELDGQTHCSLNYAVAAAVDAVSAALTNAGADTLAKNYFLMDAGLKSCDILRDEAACFANSFCKWAIHEPGGGFSCAGDEFKVADASQCVCANVSSPSIGSFEKMKEEVSRKLKTWCDAPLVNVVVEQNACYRVPKWFTDRASPSTGTARSGNFDPSTAWRAFDAFDEDETSDDDVIADVPQTLGHLLLNNTALDSDSDSWAHGSVVAQLLADAALAAYKRGARSAVVGADIAVVRAAHVANHIPAGPFTRGDAATTLSSPDATFKVADMTGAAIKTLLTNGATASDSSQFAYAAGARFSFDKTTGTASDFEVLADGSDREWTALVDTETYVVVLAGTETQTGTDVEGTMRDVFFEYAMSVGVLLRPPPRSRSLRELTTTSAGVNAHDFHPEDAAHMKLVVHDGSAPTLLVYSNLTDCVNDSGGVVATEVEDADDPCAHGEVDIVRVNIPPGTLPSDNLVVTEEWTDALECPRDAETNARTPAMFTFYNASGDAPAYAFDGVRPRSAPEAEESVASGRRKLLSSSSAGAPAAMPAASGTRRALLQQAVPTGWTCPESWYGTDDGCDCDCGAPDPDCTQNGDCGDWTWPDLSSTCDMLRAKSVCSGNDESSCPTEAPYECVFLSSGSYGRRKLLDHDSAGCKMNDAQYLALDGYYDCWYDSSSQTCYSSSGRFEQECASRVGDSNTCYTSPNSDRLSDAVYRATNAIECYIYGDSSSCNAAPGCQYDSESDYCRINREGVETAMSDVGANEAVAAYAINLRQWELCRLLGDDPASCASARCEYRGCYGGSSCAARDFSNCEVDSCVWNYHYDYNTGLYSYTCSGPSGCEVHTDGSSCEWDNPNTCYWGGCQENYDYKHVRVAAACDSIFTAADLDLIARNGPGYDSWAQFRASLPAIPCAANEHVQSGICVACPSGAINAAGDDPSGPDTECVLPGISIRDGGDVAGSPCYHILGAETGSRRGTQRFFCDASGSLTAVKWFTGLDGELKNPSCDVSAVPDEISYGAHRINSRNDLASCDAPSAFDAARSLAFAKLEGSCGSFAHAAAYARLDGRAGPFASGTRYAFPMAQRREGAPWGCSTDDCNRARQLGYDI